MSTYQSRWGHHPISYQDFLILKAIHKRYWATLREAYSWQRWKNKTVNQVGEEPEIDPIFIEANKRSYFTTTMKNGDQRWHNLRFVRKVRNIVEDFNNARMPIENPEDVVEMTTEDLNFYKKVYQEMMDAQSA